MASILADEKFKDQLSATVVNEINFHRIESELKQLDIQDESFSKAIGAIDKVRQFIGTPEKILGSEATKHGEIAEQVEVGVRRAEQALGGQEMTATFEGVGRTAPEDYIIDGVAVQSKFINGTNNNLTAVLDHMDKYSDFGRDGSYYHIPKDEYDLIEKIRNSEAVDNLNKKTIQAIKEKIERIELESGHPFAEVVKPGVSKYGEVQQGKVHQTLDGHEETLKEENKVKKEQIAEDYKPSLQEGVKATAIAGAVGAAVSLTTSLYKKNKEGKKFYQGDFTSEDWKEVGVDTAKGGALGALSGTAIYGLTNYASLSAPFAGAVVSVTKGVGSLVSDLNAGKINQDEFIELGMVVCAEAAIVGFATAVGQVAIPVPVLGAVIGSVAGVMLANSLGAKNRTTARMIKNEMDEYLATLDIKYQTLVAEINVEFNKLGELTTAAFDLENNTKLLSSSVSLARAYGVDEKKILKSTSDVDAFMLA